MKRFFRTQWLRALLPSKRKTITKKPNTCPILEHLESRLAPATFIWSGGGGTNTRWTLGSNWVGGVAPTGSAATLDDLVFPSTATQRSTFNDIPVIGGVAAKFNSITISAGNYTLAGNPISLGDPSVSNGGFIIVNSGALNNTISLDTIELAGAGGSRQFFTVQFGSDLNISGRLVGATGVELTKGGQGSLTLSGDNGGFTGPISLDNNGGVVTITNVAALGTTSEGTRVGTNATLRINNVVNPILEPLILNGPGIDNFGALQNLAGNNVWAGPISLDSNSTIGGPAGTLEITGEISDLGAGHNLTKEGAGQIILSNANTYRGLTTINNGVLTIRNPLALGLGGAATNGTVVNQTLTGRGTLQLEDPSGVGFIVLDEHLTLNGQGFNNQGALNNILGDNEWASFVTLGSLPPRVTSTVWISSAILGEVPTNLTISGLVRNNPNPGAAVYSLVKRGGGRVTFNNDNTYTGSTTVQQGILNIRDSGALGPVGATVVQTGAALELEVDTGFDPHGRPLGNDSVTGVPNRLLVSESITINGRGFFNTGALRSVSGINTITTPIILGQQASVAGIGVDPDPDPSDTNDYFTDDYSLTAAGGIEDQNPGNPTDLAKVVGGHLILPTNNNNLRGNIFIEQGWVTAQQNRSLGADIFGLGDTRQPFTRVTIGSALHFRTLNPGGTLTVPENLILAGTGILHPFALISQKGALMNLEGNNTVTGDIKLSGQVGIGVEQTDTVSPAARSELTTTGWVADFGSFTVDGTASGGPEEDSNIIDTGSNGGTLQISYDFFGIPDQIKVYYPPRGFAGSTLLVDTGVVSGAAVLTVPYGPGSSRLVEIVVNEGGSPNTNTAWQYTATIIPTSPPNGGITKLGSKRLNVQGHGTYTGDVLVQEGVLRAQNDTALGDTTKGTTVEPGAAMELSAGIKTNNGGISTGLNVWNEHLTLKGTGNTTNGALIHPLTVLDSDHMWRGPITLETDITIDTRAGTRLNLFRTVDDAANTAGTSDLTKIGIGELALAGSNTYRGVTYVNEGIVTVQNGLALGAGGASSGTEVVSTASLQLQGDITVAGESLKIIGTGTGALPSLPIGWFNAGPRPINNGETPGNKPVTGRVTGVAVDHSDPNVIYLTAGTGGVWKTKDGGKTWHPLLDTIIDATGNPVSLQTMFTGAIVVAPNDPRIIYVGTGEMAVSHDSYAGIGILKSTDSGRTWQLDTGPGDAFVGKAITKIVVEFNNDDEIYAAVANAGGPGAVVGNGGIWRLRGSWVNLTQIVSPKRLAQTPPITVPGPDDDFNQQFFVTDDYTDVVIAHDPSDFFDINRIIAFAIGGADLPEAFFDTSGNPHYSNGVFVSLSSGEGFDPTINNWELSGMTTTESNTYPINGVIKLAISSTNPGGKTNGEPGDFRLYAAISWPGLGFNTTPNLPFDRPFGSNNGSEYTLRSLQRAEINWTANGYDLSGWTALNLPPPYVSSTVTTPHGPLQLGFGNYATTIAAEPATRPEANDENNDVLYVGGIGFPYGAGFLKSTNGGNAWIDFSVGIDNVGPGKFYHAITFDSANLPLVGTDTGIFKMTDVGAGSRLWSDINGNLAITQLNGVDVHPNNLDIAYVGAQSNGQATFNGAQAWLQTDGGTGGRVFVDPKSPNIIYHVKTTHTGGWLRQSLDAGATWTDILRLDSGVLWSPLIFDAQGNLRPLSDRLVKHDPRTSFVVDNINTSRLVVAGLSTIGANPIVQESTNRGAPGSWVNLQVPATFPGASLLSSQVVALATFQGNFNADPGFTQVFDKGANTYDPDTIYVAAIYQDDNTGALLWRLAVTKNHGVSWQLRTLDGGLGDIADIFVHPSNRDTIYAVRATFDGAGRKVYKSIDAGRTWTNINFNLPDLPVWTVKVDPRNDNIYVGTDQGVYKLADGVGSTTWERFGSGMPNVQVKHMELSTSLNTLTAGTYGRSMFQMFLPDQQQDGGVLRAVSGSSVWTGPIQLTGPTTISAGGIQTLQGGRATAQLNILGTISDAVPGANHTLTKIGPGDVILSGANTYGGVTIVKEGVLVVNNPQALGSSQAKTVVDNLNFPNTALELQSDLIGEPLELRGNGISFNGHDTGVLRNVSNNNKYTGVATLLGDITIGVDSGSSLRIADTGTITDNGANFAVKKELTGTLIFQTANSYGGFTTVQQGALNVRHTMALGGTINGTEVVDGAQLQIERNAITGIDTVIANELLFLSGTGIFGTGALLNTIGNNTWQGPITLNSKPNVSPPTTPPVNIAIGVSRPQDNLTVDGIIGQQGGTFGLSKVGPGRLTLTRTNTYGGLTTVFGGALRIQDGGALGLIGQGTVVQAGATLEVDGTLGNLTTLAEPLTLNGTGIGGTGALRNVVGNNTYTGPVTLQTNSSIGVDAGTQLSVTGVVRDPTPLTTTAANLTKVGLGTLVFPNANTYGGQTFINQGILNIRNATSLGVDSPEVQTVTVFGSNGTFTLNFNDQQTIPPLPLTATDTQVEAALNLLSTIGGVGGSVTVTRSGGIFTVTFGGSLLGQDLPQMTATGEGGTMATVNTSRQGSGASTVATGATLQLQDGITVAGETLTINGPGFNNAGALENLSGNNTWAKLLTLGSNSSIGVTGAPDRLTINQTITDKGSNFGVTKVGPGTLEYAGGASTSNTYTGLTQVNEGTLALNKTGGATAIAGNLTIGDAMAPSATAQWLSPDQVVNTATVLVNNDGLLDLNNQTETIATLRVLDGLATTGSMAGVLTVGALDMVGGTITAAAAGTLVLNGNVTATSSATAPARLTGPGQVSLGGATRVFDIADGPQVTDMIVEAILSGTGSEGLTKNGAGRLELDAINTYTGPTRINAGDVQVDGTIGAVQLTGGTLSGIGAVGTLTGASPAVGTVNPGDNGTASPTGILTVGNTTWGAETTFFVDLRNSTPGTGHDQLVVNGNIDLGGATLTGQINPAILVNDTFTIMQTVGGVVSGKFAEPFSANTVFLNGKKFRIDYSDPTKVVLTRVKNDVQVALVSSANPSVFGQVVTFTATVTPEPGAGPLPTSTTVTFTLDTTIMQSINLDANGQAVFDPAAFTGQPLSVGTHTIRAMFDGDADTNTATKDLAPDQVVNKASTTITVSASPPVPVFGQTVTVFAQIRPVAPGAGVPTGLAIFNVDGVDRPPVMLTGPGNVQIDLNGLSVNVHRIKVSYTGDSSFAESMTTNDFLLNVVKAGSSVAVTAQPTSTTLGEQVTFTATVTATPPGSGTPSGTVQFFDGPVVGGTLLGSATLNNGVGTFSISTLTVGTHQITVTYSGDTSFLTAEGSTNFTVDPAITTTTIAPSVSPSVFGQQVTFTATVTTNVLGIGTPQGTVTFVIDGVNQAPVPVNALGKASFQISNLSVADHTIVAMFDGTGNFGDSDSPTLPHTVNKANTTTTVISSLNPSAVGQAVTFTAIVAPVAPGGFVPTGSVIFTIDGQNTLPVALNAQGRASVVIPTLAFGNHTITARYQGSGNHNTSTTQTALTQRVVGFSTTTTITKSVATSVFGQGVTFTANVISNGGGIPIGTVTFVIDGAIQLVPVPLNAQGKVSVTIPWLGVGQHTIQATYNGGTNFSLSQGQVAHTVNKASSFNTITSSRNPALIGQAVTITTTVRAVAPGSGTPTGTVTFWVNGQIQTPVNVNATGQASIVLNNLPLGSHAIVARYNGSGNFEASNSTNVLTQIVQEPPATTNLAAVVSPTNVGVLTPFTITVFARDAQNNLTAHYNGPVSITLLSGPVGGVLAGTLNRTFVNGIATFSGLTVSRAGRYLVRITSGTLITNLEILTFGRQT